MALALPVSNRQEKLAMKAFPHEYLVTVVNSSQGDTYLGADHLPMLQSAAPPEFGGPGGRWSPETLLVAAVGDCFAITFQGIARTADLSWKFLQCEVTGTLDRHEGVPQFTGFEIRARLGVPTGTSRDLTYRVLEKAEHRCLIANSLKASVRLAATIEYVEPVQAA
jgi:organic hydroperoxide reductase OsmC/OhrA